MAGLKFARRAELVPNWCYSFDLVRRIENTNSSVEAAEWAVDDTSMI
jgi:hypothetical protein